MSEVTASQPSRRPSPVPLRVLGDDRLARLAADGDRKAFAEIYERHHQALYRYCRSLLHNSEDATDALQTTMVNALRGMAARNGDAPLKPWFFRIAHNEAINLLRRRRPEEGLAAVAVHSGADPERDAATHERLRQLVADLHELPERQRGALVMRELSGLEYEEIAGALGLSPAAAKQSVYEARAALHERAEGRDMDCDAVRRSLSDGDRRRLRGRKVRAHLVACGGCATFAEALRTRPAQLAGLTPPLAPAAAASVLHGVLGGSGAGGGGAAATVGGAKGAGAAAGAGGEGGTAAAVASGAGKTIAGSLALKTAATVAAATTAVAAAGAASGHLPFVNSIFGSPPPSAHARPHPAAAPRPAGGGQGLATPAGRPGDLAKALAGDGGKGRGGKDGSARSKAAGDGGGFVPDAAGSGPSSRSGGDPGAGGDSGAGHDRGRGGGGGGGGRLTGGGHSGRRSPLPSLGGGSLRGRLPRLPSAPSTPQVGVPSVPHLPSLPPVPSTPRLPQVPSAPVQLP